MNRNRSKIRLLIVLMSVLVANSALAQYQENPEEGASSAHRQEDEVYRERTLRRIEIVTIIDINCIAYWH